ncbi:hypothetical protein JCM16303_001831 [Sporobolomyces ruberrimus]
MSMPTIHESGIHKGPSPDQATVRPVEKPVSPRGSEPGTTTRPEPSSELSSLPPSSSSIEPRSSSPVKVTQEGRGNAGQGFINSDHSTPTAPVQPTPVPIEPIQERPAAVKTDTNMHHVGPPTPAASVSPPQPTSIPLPSFLSEDPLSSDPDSSSDEDLLGLPKPSRSPKFSKSTGLPRPRPNYYYDAEYDPGTAGTKKRGRRGGFKGVPVFEPTMKDFEENGGFYGYVKRIEKYGLRSGIVKVIPPKEWSASLPTVLPPLKDIRLREPIEQHMMGSQGLYRVTNVAKSKIWNPAQWKVSAEDDRYDAPDLLAEQKKGDRSERSTKSTSAATEGRKKQAAAAKIKREKEDKEKEADGEFDADEEDEEGGEGTPKKGRRTPAKKAGRPTKNIEEGAVSNGTPPTKKKRLTALQKSEPTEEEWQAFSDKFEELPHGMKKEDYTVEMMRDFERRYWRTLTFGESPMYGADMAGSLFNDSTTAWNVAHLGDLLPKLAPRNCSIPGVVSPYLYFGMWRATFAWHVEDADLYSINYIHFGAPKFWYSVPQEQSEKFERVMEGFFPTDRSRCSQFLRHKAFLASPRVLSNNGITLNRCAQLPGEFILTYPKGYHSGFNLGYNCAESINFATERWLPLGKVAKSCHCIDDSVSIDVNIWLKEAAKAEALDRGEAWPYDPPEPGVVSTVSTSTSSTGTAPVQRKRMASTSDAPPRKRTKPAPPPPIAMYETQGTASLTHPQRAQLALYIQQQAQFAGLTSITLAQQTTLEQQYLRLLAQHLEQQRALHQQQQQPQQVQPQVAPPKPKQATTIAVAPSPPKPEFVCALCPDLNTEGLVAIGEAEGKSKKKLQAHRICVMFTPATWIELDEKTGEEMVRGFGKIEKARWKLKCSLCTVQHGVKVQCTSGKCAKAFHVSCALVEGSGIFLDATLPEVGGGQVSVLAQRKAGDAPGTPSKEAEPEQMPEIEPEGELKLTILCRTHNPDWKLQEQVRKADELRAKLEALKEGDRIRVKIGNGSWYDVYFLSNVPEKESVMIAHEDRSTAVVKWKNIQWPESEEARLKKEEAARKSEEQKAAALDRAAYRETSKKRAPQVPSAAPMVQSRSGSYYAPPPPQQPAVAPQHYSGTSYQHGQYPSYPYPSPTPSYHHAQPAHPVPPPAPYAYPQGTHFYAPHGHGQNIPRPSYDQAQMARYYAQQGYPQPQYSAPPNQYHPVHPAQSNPSSIPYPSPYHLHNYPSQPPQAHPAPAGPPPQTSHSFSHLLNAQPSSRPQSPFTHPHPVQQ